MGLFSFLKKAPVGIEVQEEEGIIAQPIDGEIIPLADIGDGVFSAGILGDGCVLIPSAPISGTISTVAETKHAVGIEGNGIETLVHVGLETVGMNGNGFNVMVKEGDKVKAGQLLLTFSLDTIRKTEGVKTTSAVLITNADDVPALKLLRTGTGKAGEKLFSTK